MSAEGSPRILIARMSAIGDTILTLPVACALREHFPNAYLGWVVEGRSGAVVTGHACLDEVVVLKRGWFTSARGILDTRRRLRELRFDVSIDCQGMTKSALACWLSGARQRIGLRGEHGRELSPWLNNHLIRPRNPHVVDRSLELLAPLGLGQSDIQWRFPIDDDTRSRTRDVVHRGGLDAGYAVINPGATWDSKLWEMDRFAQVAKYLAQQHNLPTLVVWGGDRERAQAESIVANSDGQARLAPATDLVELAALIENGRLFVSADTGPLHMAVAVGTPSIGLYGATRPADCGPYGPPHVALQIEYEAGSHKQRRHADNRCMRLISADMVCQECDRLLASVAKRGAA
jgi:lipopolysaccharide heptosyltransferase I